VVREQPTGAEPPERGADPQPSTAADDEEESEVLAVKGSPARTDQGEPARGVSSAPSYERATAEAASIALRSQPASVRLARRFVRAWMGNMAASRLGEDAQLAVSELVTNAIRHSVVSALHISWVEGCVRLEVDDHGGDEPKPVRTPKATSLSGRGLLIVDQIASRWGYESLPGGGKRVWCELCPDDTP
jgi:anti-sigma regulatory factor (Ser/Thr protein kinase)